MSRDSKDLIVGLDIGTSKIVALVAEVTPEGRLNVIGMGSQESKGSRRASWSTSRRPSPPFRACCRKSN
jgi:cell division ATPase FtsA